MRVLPALLLFALLASLSASPAFRHIDAARAFLSDLKRALESNDRESYLTGFAPHIRDRESAHVESMFADLGMETVSIFVSSLQPSQPEEFTAFLRVLFENDFSVIMELWRIVIRRTGDGWMVRERRSVGESKRLFKLAIPGTRAERVRKLEVSHEDITISFRDAVVFYDNIPDLETALIVMGKGRLNFSPSHPREQHQLEMVYETRSIQDKMDYAYFRFSNSFFQNRVNIQRDDSTSRPVRESERDRAASLFAKHNTRSFTVRNSLNGEDLSVLPQSDEAVFEFRGDLVGDVTYVYSPFADDEINFYQWKENRILNLYSPPFDKGEKRLFISFGQKFDVLDYAIELDFDPKRTYFAGKAQIRVETRVALLDSLRFKLHPDLEILRITDDNHRELYYTRDSLRKVIYIHFLHPPKRGQTATIEVYYRGTLAPPQLYSDTVTASGQESSIRLQPFRFDSLLYSRSAFWYPAPADQDYFTARLKLIIPPQYIAVATGRLTERSRLSGLENVTDVEKIGNSVFVFTALNPVKYLSFVVGRMSIIEEVTEGIPMRYYRSLNTRPDHWEIFDASRDILEYYQDLFGPYPYEKFTIVKRLWNTAGGHSPASFIVLNELPRSVSQRLRGRSSGPVDLSRWREYFLAHEIAHQWWGQGISWASYRDQWLSEGMAQFAAVLYLRKKYGEKDFSRILDKFARGTKKKSIWGGITMGSRISYFDFEAYQTIVYNKAALVLNMLRDLLGDDIFFAGIQRFYSRHRYNAASTGEFVNIFHDLSGRELQGFFDPWLHSHRLPDVAVAHDVVSTSEGKRLRFDFVQRGESFVFPLWIEWRERGVTVRKKILIDQQRVVREFPVDARPGKIRVNPETAVPGKFKVR